MFARVFLVQGALLLLSAVSFYTTWYLFVVNGSADIIHLFKTVREVPTQSSPQKLLTTYTGIGVFPVSYPNLRRLFCRRVLSNTKL